MFSEKIIVISDPLSFDSGCSLVVLEEGCGGIREDQILQLFFQKT
jgi:hypothetical protein